MNDSKYLKAAQMIGLKNPLIDESTFVGRKREVKKILTSIEGSQVTSVWLWGPRKIGKSSLSYRIPTKQDLRTIRISYDLFEWGNIDIFSEIIAKEAYTQIGIKLQGSGKSSLSELATLGSKEQRIFLIVDEFDRIAVNLQQYEQAFLRATLQNNQYFGIIFISRIKPEELLQDYSEENSRLLGICDIIRVPMLNKNEVADLIRITEKFCMDKFPNWVSTWIYEKVGGYPVCVQSLLKEFLIQADLIGSFPSESEIKAKEYLFFDAVRYDLERLWKDLPYSIRKVLLDENNVLAENIKRELMVLNLMENDKLLKPIWLIEVGNELKELTDNKNLLELVELAERLSDSLRMCNDISLRKGRHQVFQTTQQTFRLFEIGRPVDDEPVINERINLLYKICVENTNSDKLLKDDRCLIPIEIRPIYKKSEGFQILAAWRNFCFHDPSHDLGTLEKSERYTNIGDICCKYLGPGRIKPKDKADFNRIYKGILADVVESVERLRKALEEEL